MQVGLSKQCPFNVTWSKFVCRCSSLVLSCRWAAKNVTGQSVAKWQAWQ